MKSINNPAASMPAFRHILYPADHRWRCVVFGRSFGTAVAKTDFDGSPLSFDVLLDDGSHCRVFPSDIASADNVVPHGAAP